MTTGKFQITAEELFTSDIGVCTVCLAEHDGCEPDAAGYQCYECGTDTVVGIETAHDLDLLEITDADDYDGLSVQETMRKIVGV